jgi:hypothetical protein
MRRITDALENRSNFMQSYKVSFSLSKTSLPINELRAWLARNLEQMSEQLIDRPEITNLSVLKGVESRADQKRRLIAEQQQWIEQCGGTIAGYVKRYGSCKDEEYFGAGGEAIYAADIAQLNRLEEM